MDVYYRTISALHSAAASPVELLSGNSSEYLTLPNSLRDPYFVARAAHENSSHPLAPDSSLLRLQHHSKHLEIKIDGSYMSFFRRPSSPSSSEDEDSHHDRDNSSNNENANACASDAEFMRTTATNPISIPKHDILSKQLRSLDINTPYELQFNINTISNSIRKSCRLSISNRLLSIRHDSLFVTQVASAFPFPLVANERCGSWYIQPQLKAGSCYFKSTDGHSGQWKFSSRRLNLGLLNVIEANGGCVVVDSTRRGKSMPDALSKTIPIWCAVLNHVLFPEVMRERNGRVYLPPGVISSSEASQIACRLPGFITDFLALDLDLVSLRNRLMKPMRPIWINPSSALPSTPPVFEGYYPVVLVSASEYLGEGEEGRVVDERGRGFGYVQGAGDDHEGWSLGLDSIMFWRENEILLRTDERDLPDIIKSIISQTGHMPKIKDIRITRVGKVGGMICITDEASFKRLVEAEEMEFGDVVLCSDDHVLNRLLEVRSLGKVLPLSLPTGKNGSKFLRDKLAKVVDFAKLTTLGGKILVIDKTGNDFAIGVALTLLCTFFNDEGKRLETGTQEKHEIDKALIRRRLGWIVSERSEANPSRATLQAVKSFLMSP